MENHVMFLSNPYNNKQAFLKKKVLLEDEKSPGFNKSIFHQNLDQRIDASKKEINSAKNRELFPKKSQPQNNTNSRINQSEENRQADETESLCSEGVEIPNEILSLINKVNLSPEVIHFIEEHKILTGSLLEGDLAEGFSQKDLESIFTALNDYLEAFDSTRLYHEFSSESKEVISLIKDQLAALQNVMIEKVIEPNLKGEANLNMTNTEENEQLASHILVEGKDSDLVGKVQLEDSKKAYLVREKSDLLHGPAITIREESNKLLSYLYQGSTFDELLQELKPTHFNSTNIKGELPIPKILYNSILNQLVQKADILVRENSSEMQLKLKPENLGNLTMNIAVEKGIVIAKIVAENQVVKEALESNFNSLKDALNEKGFGIQELSVSVGQENLKERRFFQFTKPRPGKIEFGSILNKSVVDDNGFKSTPKAFHSTIDFFA